jgi:hypothetical protein
VGANPAKSSRLDTTPIPVKNRCSDFRRLATVAASDGLTVTEQVNLSNATKKEWLALGDDGIGGFEWRIRELEAHWLAEDVFVEREVGDQAFSRAFSSSRARSCRSSLTPRCAHFFFQM